YINCQEFLCEIIHVDQLSSVSWQIPQFPAMIFDFAFVRFKKGREVLKGVFLKDELANIQPGIFTGTSHCEIVVNGE
ncbi:Hypothetical predicted protein, partial [Paramuricea clavata]